MRTQLTFLVLMGFPIAIGCADNASSKMAIDAEDDMGAESTDGASMDESEDDRDEPEVEEDLKALPPATTPLYTFVANPDRNTLTRITAEDLSVVTATVGARPTQVVTTPDHLTAITFNADGDTISVVDAEDLTVQTIQIRADRNHMVVSPDGRWAIAYYDAARDDGQSGSGAQSFNEISLVDIENLVEWSMVSGPNPSDVQFSADSSTAIVVSDTYLSRIDLSEDDPTPEHVELSPGETSPARAEEVVMTPDGSSAVVRLYGSSDLVHVDLDTMDRATVPVGDGPTDMDISSDGEELLVVARTAAEIWVLALNDLNGDAEVIDLPSTTTLGSLVLTPDDSRGVLYSTASGDSVYAVWDRADDTIQIRDLVKPPRGVGINPTGSTAIISHSTDNGTDVSTDSAFYNEPALSIVDLDSLFSSSLLLPSEATTFAHTADGETGFFIMEGEPYLEVLDYGTLIHEEITLKSQPVFLGSLPQTNSAFISQEHRLGRISFFDADTDELNTITGFELNADIEQ
jgi:DNA-binding beta-propeller fold protein YncE